MAGGEFEVAILLAPIVADHFPSHVVQGSPQIVDSVAYYESQPGRDFLFELDPDRWLASLRVTAYGQAIGVSAGEKSDLIFKIIDVMVGPLDL